MSTIILVFKYHDLFKRKYRGSFLNVVRSEERVLGVVRKHWT
jgi:hypothetical protein